MGGQRAEVRGRRAEVRGQKSEVRGRRTEGGGQRAEDRGRKSEIRSQKSEVGGQRSEVRSRRTEGRGRRSEIRGQKSEGRSQRAEFGGQKSEVGGQRSEVGGGMMRINSAKELTVYQKAYELAMEIFEVSKSFPAEKKYALTGQIRRSSRSVCLNLREAWAKRKYEAHRCSLRGMCNLAWNMRRVSWAFILIICRYCGRCEGTSWREMSMLPEFSGIERRLDELNERLGRLGALKDSSREEFDADPYLRDIVERKFEVAAQC